MKKLVLYDNGDQCNDITGGWGVIKQTAAISSNTLDVYSSVQNGTYQGIVCTKNKIDVTEYTKVNLEYTTHPGGGIVYLSSRSEAGIIGHDVSKLTTACYVGLYAINAVGWNRYTHVSFSK